MAIPATIPLGDLIEQMITQNKELFEIYNKNNKLFDFVPGDFVNCSYISGVFKVISFEDNKLVIKNLRDDNTLHCSPQFLEKVPLNSKWVNTLYNK